MDAPAQQGARSAEGRDQAAIRAAKSQEAVKAFCGRWKVKELALFGSVLRDDFGPNSDVDVLVSFQDDQSPGLLGIVRMEGELTELLSRKVDLVTRTAIENSRNYIRRESILKCARVVYPA